MEKINLTDFQKRKFSKCFIAVYVVTKDIKIRTDTCITNKKLYIVFGLDIMGYRQILGMAGDHRKKGELLNYILNFFIQIKVKKINKMLIFA